MYLFLRTALFALMLGIFSAVAVAQGSDLQGEIDTRTEAITASANALTEDDTDLLALREALFSARRDALRTAETLSERLRQTESDLELLGEPIEGEAAGVSQRREALTERRGALTAQISQSELNAEEADRLLGEIAELRFEQLYAGLSDRSASPVLPSQLASAGAGTVSVVSGFQSGARSWFAARQAEGTLFAQLALLAAGLVFALLMAIPVRRWIARQVTTRIEAQEPLQSRRVLAAASKAVSRSAPALLGGLGLYQTILLVGLVEEQGAPVLRLLWIGLVTVILTDGTVTAVFSPRNRNWRLFSISDGGARWIRGLATLIAFVILCDLVLLQLLRTIGTDVSAELAVQGLSAILIGALFIAITRGWAWRETEPVGADAGTVTQTRKTQRLPLVGLLVGGGLIVAALVGYVAAAHFLATRIAFAVGVIGIAVALRALLREGVRLLDSRFRSSISKESDDSERMVFFWIGFLLDALVIAVVLPALFLLFGADWADVRAVIGDALFGFQIGSVRISILQIFTAIAVFAGVLAATRFVQRTADKRVFPRTRMDVGVQNSLKTLIGYVGLVIAFMTGVGMLGFDLSNLAIIAGALSVGIGFGLQSIVNNFVSGLILLFERPIKVGDWIVTTSGEGIVKRISVRSTEIETFDRSSIIVPNSELISSSVTNWTHKNRLGRVTVPVGVSYNEDPDRILEILRGIPKQVEIVLNFPEPLVLFTGFGDSSLDFEIRAFVSDVSTSLAARTALRVAIFKAFKENNVEIPFPQRDLHVRSGLDRALTEKPEASNEG